MITAADVIEDPMKRRTFLLKQANEILKKRPNKKMFELRNQLRKEGKNLKFYVPIMEDLAKEIQLHYMFKDS